MINKFLIIYRVFLGYVYKWLVDIHVLKIPALVDSIHADIVVSLTSYGRRVSGNIVYYTIVSLLRQKIHPSRIMLWLAEDEWSDETIPDKLKTLVNKGIEVRYCEDLKSYKKLIPTLKSCPNYTIVTVDDDVIYSKDTLSTLIKEHQKYPQDIICLHAAKIVLEDGIPCNYIKWKDLNIRESGVAVFPIGEGGVLYPNGCFHEDVLRVDLFEELCPFADDIWFWICGIRNGTNKRFITKSGNNLSFDMLYQYLHKGTALTHNNRFEDSNDIQFKNAFDYYSIRIDSKGTIKK